MPHPPELIQRVAQIIQADYPGASLFLEQRLPGTTRSPDVWVRDLNGAVVCVVEIGYTDAAKLRLYRELKVPDIRWYDKEVNLALRETLPVLPPPPKPIPLPPKARRWNDTEILVANYLEMRVKPPDHIVPNEGLDEMFPGPFGWYVTPIDCSVCVDTPEGKIACNYGGKMPNRGDDSDAFRNTEDSGCVAVDVVFFDHEKVATYTDCHCTEDHSAWTMEESHEDWDETYTSHCRRLRDMLEERALMICGDVSLLIPRGFDFFQAARYSYTVRNGPPMNGPPRPPLLADDIAMSVAV